MKGYKTIILVLLLFFCVLIFISASVGSVSISYQQLFQILIGNGEEQTKFILIEYRLPRIILSIIVGASLAIAGAILQGIIRNPMASPDVIGLSKGAGFSAVAVIILFPMAPIGILPLAAFLGAATVGLFLLFLLYRFNLNPTTLALSGIAIGAISGAGIQYLSVKNIEDANSALLWLAGSLWGRGWEYVTGVLPWFLILLPLPLLLSKRLDVLGLGDDIAEGLGTLVKRTRIQLLALSVIFTGMSVAVAGTIGFIGLIAPHMARRLVGPLHYKLLPVSALLGAIVLLLGDTIGRVLIVPREIPAGIVTAVIGAPYFLYLIRRENRGKR